MLSRKVTGAVQAPVRLGGAGPVNGVLLKIFPRLLTVREDRELLRLVQTYGEVTSFFNMKMRWPVPAPNRYMVTFKTAEEASLLLRAAPIRFNFDKPADEQDETSAVLDAISAHLEPSSTENPFKEPADQFSSHPAGPTTTYTLRAAVALQDHMKVLQRSAYWGPFNPATKRVEFQDLVDCVPNFGLADITSLNGPAVPSAEVARRAEVLERRPSLRAQASDKFRRHLFTNDEIDALDTEIGHYDG